MICYRYFMKRFVRVYYDKGKKYADFDKRSKAWEFIDKVDFSYATYIINEETETKEKEKPTRKNRLTI